MKQVVDKLLCLQCELDDCDETNSGCKYISSGKRARQKWYKNLKADAVRYAEYLKKVNKGRRALYFRSSENRKKRHDSAIKWQQENREAARKISRRYHRKHKERRNAEHREYMEKRRRRLYDNI